jgi:uncharacterized protein involved in exopolysaccharide biosynthesis
MQRITPYVREEHIEQIEEMQKSTDSDISDAEAVRRIFDRAAETKRFESELESLRSDHEAEVERIRTEHEAEIERLEARIDELQAQLRAANSRNEEHTELVRYVEEELSYREAGLGTRMKWWFFGKGE